MDSNNPSTLPNVKKRLHMGVASRLPLQETSGNIPSPILKKTKLNNSKASASTTDSTNENSPSLATVANKLNSIKPLVHEDSQSPALQRLEGLRFQSQQPTSTALRQRVHNDSTQVMPRPDNLLRPQNHQQAQQHQSRPRTQARPSRPEAVQAVQNRTHGRLAGDELHQWQQSWKKIMRESIVYFEGVSEHNTSQTSEYEMALKYLKQVGCEISTFYDGEVTIIISRRQYDPSKTYPQGDIFSRVSPQKIKVWDYSKVFRFLKNLGVNIASTDNTAMTTGASYTATSATEIKPKQRDNLYNLLKEEKIYGTNDRDPTARRDDLHYLDKNYLYVYDLSQKVRPIAVREWNDDTFPVLRLTMDGKCPFIYDASENSNLERKKMRREQKFELTKNYRSLLKRATYDIISNIKNGLSLSVSRFGGTSTSTDKIEDEVTIVQNSTSSKKLTVLDENDNEAQDSYHEEQEDQFVEEVPEDEVSAKMEVDALEQDPAPQEARSSSTDNEREVNEEDEETDCAKPLTYSFKHPSMPALARNSSIIQSNSKFYDVIASGYNGASNAMSVSMDTTLNSNAAQGNGLGPMMSQVPSRNVNNLNRRIFIKKKKQESTNMYNERGVKEEKEMTPGYCENCKVKYDHFDDHIKSNRHRNFACDDKNFRDIDKLSKILNERRSSGYVTSNGDYSYA